MKSNSHRLKLLNGYKRFYYKLNALNLMYYIYFYLCNRYTSKLDIYHTFRYVNTIISAVLKKHYITKFTDLFLDIV